MSTMFADIMTIEDHDEDEVIMAAAIQRTINAGTWSLQGSFGRTMMAYIEDGACMLGRDGARDYWGNYIPARSEVEQGTKGSFDYVAGHYGLDHAEEMAGL